MKKILVALFTLFVLVGCTEKGYSQISNGDDIIFKGQDIEYKKSDLYKTLKVSSDTVIEDDILRKIAIKLNVDIDTMSQEAQDEVDMYASLYDEATLMAYKEQLISEKILTELTDIYLDENFKELAKEDNPVKMQMVSFADENTANLFIEEVNSGVDFQTAATDNGYQSECPVRVYFDSDITSLNVKSYINSTASNGLSSIIIETTSSTNENGETVETNTYYVINIESRNAEEFVDDYKTAKLERIGTDGVIEYMFDSHDIKFYDQDLYEKMIAKYEGLK